MDLNVSVGILCYVMARDRLLCLMKILLHNFNSSMRFSDVRNHLLLLSNMREL